MIGDLLWRLRRRGVALAWFALLCWSSLAFRVLSESGVSALGALDDLAVVLLGLSVYGLLELTPRKLRVAAIAGLGLAVIVVYTSSFLYFRLHGSFLRFGTLSTIDVATDGRPAIEALLTPDVLTGALAVPALLMIVAVRDAASRRGYRGLGLMVVGAVLFVAVTIGRGADREGFEAAATNPVAYLLRDTIGTCEIAVTADSGNDRDRP